MRAAGTVTSAVKRKLQTRGKSGKGASTGPKQLPTGLHNTEVHPNGDVRALTLQGVRAHALPQQGFPLTCG